MASSVNLFKKRFLINQEYYIKIKTDNEEAKKDAVK